MKKKLLLLIVFLLVISLSIKNIKPYYARYIQKKSLLKVSSTIDTSDYSFNSLSLLDDDLINNEIFLAGESHGSTKSIDMNFYLIKYFIEKGDIKYILYESGYSYAQYLNIYLNTGDESILDYLFYNSSQTMDYTQENYDLLLKIYEYNLSLPEDKKIEFIGIDIETPKISIKYLKSLITDLQPTNNLEEDLINSIKSLTIKNYLSESKKCLDLLNNNIDEFQNLLGNNFFHLKYTVKNLSISSNQYYRENILINNFIELYEYLPKGKYFGQFGGGHTDLNPNTITLASYLQNTYKNTKNKVINIDYFYHNSYSYLPTSLESIESPEITEFLDSGLFSKDESSILIKLNYENSLFFKKDIYLNNFPATDRHQYLILFNGSKAANKFYHK